MRLIEHEEEYLLNLTGEGRVSGERNMSLALRGGVFFDLGKMKNEMRKINIPAAFITYKWRLSGLFYLDTDICYLLSKSPSDLSYALSIHTLGFFSGIALRFNLNRSGSVAIFPKAGIGVLLNFNSLTGVVNDRSGLSSCFAVKGGIEFYFRISEKFFIGIYYDFITGFDKNVTMLYNAGTIGFGFNF